MASVVSKFPLPDCKHPYSLIGCNLNDGTLHLQDKDEFTALIDFRREKHIKEREIQIQALEETNTKYIILDGSYTIREIREIYRKCSIFFLAFRESFGLPIPELQACGSYIFIPYKDWTPAHYIKPDLRVAGEGELSSNFIVYNNDKEKLKNEINRIKRIYDPDVVFETFIKNHPQLFYGDIEELKTFVNKIKQKQIHTKLHNKHKFINDLIIDSL
jgi:glycosyltransferase involved in cell wall biosynthesis